MALDDIINSELKNPRILREYIENRIRDKEVHYIFLDEIQMVTEFEALLNGLGRIANLDIYVTGSKSKFLSIDILTKFRGRGDEVRVYPLSFSEFSDAFHGDKELAWYEYFTYGGLPMILNFKSNDQKSQYLSTLFVTKEAKDTIFNLLSQYQTRKKWTKSKTLCYI